MNDRWTAPRGAGQPDRFPVKESWLAELPSAAYGDDGYDWAELLAFIRSGKITPAITRAELDQLARELYQIGFHAFDDVKNPLDLTPFDALRKFLDTGTLPVEYGKLLTTPTRVLTEATAFRNAFIDNWPKRNHTAAPLVLVAGSGFFQDPWIVLDTPTVGVPHWLADNQGRPLHAPAGFRILPGCRFLVTGHLSDHAGGGQLLMVDSISLLDAPLPGMTDSDGNLLGDNWEAFHYGTLGNDPFVDLDGDNYLALQEMFENTDPRYGREFPPVPALDLRPPRLELEYLGNRQSDLSWRWPAIYQDRVRFFLEGGTHLQNFQLLQDNVPATMGDLFETSAAGTAASYFYSVGFGLR